MRALQRKLLRDLRAMASQALSIALVVAAGVAGGLTSLSAVDSLAAARDRFYAEARFAELFVSLKRAPQSLLPLLAAQAGVAALQATVEQFVRVEVAGSHDPVVGQLIGLDADGPAGPAGHLNRIQLRAGRFPEPGEAGEAIAVVASAGFAQARGLGLGSELRALINGRQRSLRIVGLAVSPEFVFAGFGGMPDLRGFGVFWMEREQLAAAYQMRGAFNRLAVKLAPGASEAAVAARLSARLAPYGAREVHGRSAQTSHAMLDNEIKEQRVFGTVLPLIFMAVAAFLLHVVVARLVATQREQIAALKALGYANRALVMHYLQLVLIVVALGCLLGLLVGKQLGQMFTHLYAEFFFFPRFEHRLDPWLTLFAVGLAVLTGVAGTLGALWHTVRLAPAEAMRPPSPGRYRHSRLEGLGLRSTVLRMILRQMERRPLRSLLAVLGVAAAVAIVVLGNFVRDAIDHIADTQFNRAMRGDVFVWSPEALPAAAVALELARLPGAQAVEAQRVVPVRLLHGARSERLSLQGVAPQAQLQRVVDAEGRVAALPLDGLLLTDRLARKLDVAVGDPVEVEVLEGAQRRLRLTVAATASDMMGLNALMSRELLNRRLGDGDLANQWALRVEAGREPELLEASRRLPRVAGAFSKAVMWKNMEAISARNVRIMATVLTAFACVIAVGVVYNNARIQLAERGWELASLRVLGFTRAEVSRLLLGEQALLLALALPLGMLLGRWLVGLIATLLASDQFLFPVVIRPPTYAIAALAVLTAGLASALVVRRRIDRLDLVAVLKTRE